LDGGGDLCIDGRDIWPLMICQPGARSPHKASFHYTTWILEAVRSGRWKLVLPHDQYAVVRPGRDGMPGTGQRPPGISSSPARSWLGDN
jgi:hypothetical protein